MGNVVAKFILYLVQSNIMERKVEVRSVYIYMYRYIYIYIYIYMQHTAKPV